MILLRLRPGPVDCLTLEAVTGVGARQPHNSTIDHQRNTQFDKRVSLTVTNPGASGARHIDSKLPFYAAGSC